MHTRVTTGCSAAGLLLVLAGCQNSPLVEAKGRLTYKGQPLPSTLVIFQPDDGKRRSTGLTDDEGNFSLRFSRQESGVLRGSHTVFLRYIVSAEEEMHQIQPKVSADLKRVIARYGDPKKSDLHYEVTRSGDVFEIDLK
jgi:hypothetical protein